MDHSHFGQLPGEIRNQVYQYLLEETRPISLYIWQGKLHSLPRQRCSRTLAITRVCRELRVETLPIYFNLNAFNMQIPLIPARDWCHVIKSWQQTFGAPSIFKKTRAVTLRLGASPRTDYTSWDHIFGMLDQVFDLHSTSIEIQCDPNTDDTAELRTSAGIYFLFRVNQKAKAVSDAWKLFEEWWGKAPVLDQGSPHGRIVKTIFDLIDWIEEMPEMEESDEESDDDDDDDESDDGGEMCVSDDDGDDESDDSGVAWDSDDDGGEETSNTDYGDEVKRK